MTAAGAMDQPVQDRIVQTIWAAIDEFNSGRPSDRQLSKSADTALIGAQGVLDSLDLVTLLVTVEQQVATDLAAPITLASDKAFSMRNSPFATIGALADYVRVLVEEQNHG